MALEVCVLENDDRATIVNSDGDLILARLNSSEFQAQIRTKIIGRNWAYSAFARRRIDARDNTELVCVELPEVESSIKTL